MLYTRVRAKDLCTAFTTVRVLSVQFAWIPVQTSPFAEFYSLEKWVGRQKRASGQKSKHLDLLLQLYGAHTPSQISDFETPEQQICMQQFEFTYASK